MIPVADMSARKFSIDPVQTMYLVCTGSLDFKISVKESVLVGIERVG